MPLPLGEVAERCEDGEGTVDVLFALSVTFGDSSPSGRAKENACNCAIYCAIYHNNIKTERIRTDTLR